MRFILILLSVLLLSACAQAKQTTYDIPNSVWAQLTPEQQAKMKAAYEKHQQQAQHAEQKPTQTADAGNKPLLTAEEVVGNA